LDRLRLAGINFAKVQNFGKVVATKLTGENASRRAAEGYKIVLAAKLTSKNISISAYVLQQSRLFGQVIMIS